MAEGRRILMLTQVLTRSSGALNEHLVLRARPQVLECSP